MSKHSPNAKVLDKVDYSQRALFTTLKTYLALRAAASSDRTVTQHEYLPFNNQTGFCSGIGALWGYMSLVDEEGKFVDLLHHAATWDKQKYLQLLRSDQKPVNDAKLDRLMNHAFFLQHHAHTITPNTQKHDLDQSFALLLGENMPGIAPVEYSISFVFTVKELQSILEQCTRDNRIMRFENGLHAVYAVRKENTYRYLDIEHKHGLRVTDDPAELAKMVFESLSAFCHSKRHIALNMLMFKLADSPAATGYPDRMQYYRDKLKDSKAKTAVLSHPNIMRVGLRHDLPMLDLLFKHGYIPHSLPRENTEFAESILENDQKKISYLLEHQVDVNFKPAGKESALGTAIRCNAMDTLYQLLVHDANPNAKVFHNMTAIEYALYHRNRAAIILLMAYNANQSTGFVAKLNKAFAKTLVDSMHKQASELRNQLEQQNIDQQIKPSSHAHKPKKKLMFKFTQSKVKEQLAEQRTYTTATQNSFEQLVKPKLKIG